MKKIIVSLLLFTVVCNFSIAQIIEEERVMTQGIKNALTITIPNADDRMVEKLWKKFMKTKDSKTKKIKKSEEWLSENAKISGIGGANVYAAFDQSGDDVQMTAWFDLGERYLSSLEQPERYSAGEDFLNEFETEVYKESVKTEIKEEENNLKKLEADLKKLNKNNDRYHKEIKDAKKKIAKAEANIEDNLVEQDDVKAKIEDQQKIIDKTREKLEVRKDN